MYFPYKGPGTIFHNQLQTNNTQPTSVVIQENKNDIGAKLGLEFHKHTHAKGEVVATTAVWGHWRLSMSLVGACMYGSRRDDFPFECPMPRLTPQRILIMT